MSQDRIKQSGFGRLVLSVFYQQVLITIRYPAQFLGSLAVGIVVFVLLFYGGKTLAPVRMDESLGGIIVGYFLWTLSMYSYMAPARGITDEASWGTLERHIATPFGFAPVMFLKGIAKVLRSFMISAIILLFALLLTGKTLTLNPFSTIPLLILTLASVLGLGFAMAGLAVLYKKLSNWRGFFNFALVPLVSAPAFDAYWIRFFPVAQGSIMLHDVMLNGKSLFSFLLIDHLILAGVAVFYCFLGYVSFQWATNKARREGVLGDY